MMVDIMEAYAALCADLGVTVQADSSVDDTWAEPFTWEPNTLYLFGTRVAEVPLETGPTVRQEFAFNAVFLAEGHEEAGKQREQGVSHLLDDVREFLMTTARTHQSTVTWDHLRAAETPNRPRTLQGRAVAVELSGWRVRG